MLPDLSGTWRIRRRIIGENARFEGVLTLTPKGDHLLYEEKGTLVLPHIRTEAYRSYIYRPDGDRLGILYDDGRPFLNLVFKDGKATDTHLCSPDTYRATFKIKNPDEWLYGFAVRGPRKDYYTVSHMTRV